MIDLDLTEVEIMEKLTGESDEDLLSLLLNDAEEFLLNEMNRTWLPDRLQKVKRDIAVIAYNRLGTEGESSRTEAGESYTFESLPAHIRSAINKNRIARCGGYAHEAQQEEDDTSQES